MSRSVILLLLMTSTSMQIASAQDSKKEKEAAETKSIIYSKNFVFTPQSATPTGGKLLPLTGEFHLIITEDTVISYLPYYGRAYSPPVSSNSGGITFTSTDYQYSIAEEKKGGWEILIQPKDVKDVDKLSLTVFENGNASLQVMSRSRQPISYRGYISANKSK